LARGNSVDMDGASRRRRPHPLEMKLSTDDSVTFPRDVNNRPISTFNVYSHWMGKLGNHAVAPELPRLCAWATTIDPSLMSLHR
jgi:hypothetical protein